MGVGVIIPSWMSMGVVIGVGEGGGMGSGTVGKPKLGRLYLVIFVLGSVL